MRRIYALFLVSLCLALGSGARAQTPGSIIQTAVNCGTGGAQVLAAAKASFFIFVSVPSTASTGVWFNWTGADAVQAPPSEYIPAGGFKVWGTSPGMLPTTPISCIASSTVAITLEYK